MPEAQGLPLSRISMDLAEKSFVAGAKRSVLGNAVYRSDSFQIRLDVICHLSFLYSNGTEVWNCTRFLLQNDRISSSSVLLQGILWLVVILLRSAMVRPVALTLIEWKILSKLSESQGRWWFMLAVGGYCLCSGLNEITILSRSWVHFRLFGQLQYRHRQTYTPLCQCQWWSYLS